MTVPKLLTGLRRGHAAVVASDVPWKFVRWSTKKQKFERSAEAHYRTMTLAEIAALPVADYVAKDAYLFFWVTGPHLARGDHIPIMRAWGFEPGSIFNVWVKPTKRAADHGQFFLDAALFRMGMGHTSRQNAEFVVLGRRGNPPKRLSRSVRQIIVEAAREHSRKPDGFFGCVEAYAAGPYLELFGREERPGWVVRGDEVGKFKAGVASKRAGGPKKKRGPADAPLLAAAEAREIQIALRSATRSLLDKLLNETRPLAARRKWGKNDAKKAVV